MRTPRSAKKRNINPRLQGPARNERCALPVTGGPMRHKARQSSCRQGLRHCSARRRNVRVRSRNSPCYSGATNGSAMSQPDAGRTLRKGNGAKSLTGLTIMSLKPAVHFSTVPCERQTCPPHDHQGTPQCEPRDQRDELLVRDSSNNKDR